MNEDMIVADMFYITCYFSITRI